MKPRSFRLIVAFFLFLAPLVVAVAPAASSADADAAFVPADLLVAPFGASHNNVLVMTRPARSALSRTARGRTRSAMAGTALVGMFVSAAVAAIALYAGSGLGFLSHGAKIMGVLLIMQAASQIAITRKMSTVDWSGLAATAGAELLAGVLFVLLGSRLYRMVSSAAPTGAAPSASAFHAESN